MKNLLLFSFILLLGLSSCSNSNELDVSSNDVQLLQAYVDEADALIVVAGDIEGDVAEIFNSSVAFNGCPGYGGSQTIVTAGEPDEATLLLNEMLDKMGFESAVEVHDWMVDAGRIMYDIKQNNKKNFDSDRELMTELACLISPEILTRNNSTACYKDNLVALFIGTLEAGSNYATKLATEGKKSITEEGCSSRGSSFNKIWLYMKNNYNCK